MDLERKSDSLSIDSDTVDIFFGRFVTGGKISEKAGCTDKSTGFFEINFFKIRIGFYIILKILANII